MEAVPWSVRAWRFVALAAAVTGLLGLAAAAAGQPLAVLTLLVLLSAGASFAGVTLGARHERSLARMDALLAESAHIQAELRRAVEEARAASQAKSQFLASMSHELRTPLNAILGYSEILLEECEDPSSAADLDRILRAGRHLLALVNDVLDLSRVEAGAMQLSSEWLDVSKLVNEVAATVFPAAGSSDNMLVIDVEPELSGLYADPMRLRQILLNLLTNANKFTRGGLVRLSARRIEGDRIRFDVRDTGIGIAPEQIGSLFQPFRQADPSIAREYGGTGLGLALSRRFAERMEGSLTVESELGRGATFTLVLPTRTTSARLSRLEEERTILAVAATAPVVLCCDPDAASLEVLVRHLDAEGYHVVPCMDRARCVSLAKQLDVRIVTLDVSGDAGWAVLQALTSQRDPDRTGVVVVSIEDDAERSIALGAHLHLVKPVDREALVRGLAGLTFPDRPEPSLESGAHAR